jgi:cation diffusion facilitator CzcD-associated flavoprotein CzcO
MENFNTLVTGGQAEVDLVSDGWTDIIRHLGQMVPRKGTAPDEVRHDMARMMELADFKKMNQVRARVDSIVKDPKTAEALKPWYRQFCKRPTFNDEYLPTFNRPNVTLVDTRGRGVERITEKGLVFDGVEYEVDCIIFATGFEVGTAYTRRAGFEVYGRGAKSLTDYWSSGMKTLHGFFSHGFPNCFHMGPLQNAITANFPQALDEQARHITDVIQHAKQNEARSVEPSAEAEAQWVAEIRRRAVFHARFQQECTPGYYNNEGHPEAGSGFAGEQYAAQPQKYFAVIRRWRKEGMKGLELA